MNHIRAVALAIGSLVLAASAHAQDKAAADKPVQLKLSHWVPPQHPLQAAIQDWADDIKKQTGGTVTSVIFPAEQLGKAFDHYDMARDGIADGAYVNPGYQPGRFPIIAAGELPFQFRDAKAGTAALDAWYRQYAATEMKDVHYCFAFMHDPGTLHSRREIRLPTDIAGTKVRPADATMGTWVTDLGGSNVQASAPGSRDLLERGVADSLFFPWGSTVLFGIDKVTKYDIDAAMYVTTFVWVLNRAKYDSLSPNQKKAVDDHCTTDWAVRFASPWADFEHAGIAKISAEPSHTLVELTPEQLDAWKKSAEPLRQSWAAGVKKAGGDPDAIAHALADQVAQHNAGY
ncbi:MAG: TRAP transporter substrate-binding protein [Acidisphaera sp.]|nr:TRAP transporter substrate-binding protein [Acidisphaera sp.]MBV9813584.1 TRAP transporter substrate-binding protein [Acetobacteraceae bacterium]